ncbi:hypothetical protein QBC46DRAFT_409279 [Diplogelasinospora grovesii]|uniref:Uncharacterized protein n=1 Tax=Diplogelasinospora grovesii TaxID=303347 RepID=A0AAN6S3S2_9PEZI|nr:hypothetical protein QBC46DRAFT_409279 [Diplogelasinospora grovesii]
MRAASCDSRAGGCVCNRLGDPDGRALYCLQAFCSDFAAATIPTTDLWTSICSPPVPPLRTSLPPPATATVSPSTSTLASDLSTISTTASTISTTASPSAITFNPLTETASLGPGSIAGITIGTVIGTAVLLLAGFYCGRNRKSTGMGEQRQSSQPTSSAVEADSQQKYELDSTSRPTYELSPVNNPQRVFELPSPL